MGEVEGEEEDAHSCRKGIYLAVFACFILTVVTIVAMF